MGDRDYNAYMAFMRHAPSMYEGPFGFFGAGYSSSRNSRKYKWSKDKMSMYYLEMYMSKAIQNGDIDGMKKILDDFKKIKSRPRINHYDIADVIEGYTKNSESVMDFLIDNDLIDISSRDYYILSKLTNESRFDQFINMVDRYHVDVNKLPSRVIYNAARNNNTKLVKYIYDRTNTKVGMTNLALSVMDATLPDIDFVFELLNNSLVCFDDNKGCNMLVKSVRYNNIDLVKLLLSKDNIHANFNNHLAIRSAIENGYSDEIVKELIFNDKTDIDSGIGRIYISLLNRNNLDLAMYVMNKTKLAIPTVSAYPYIVRAIERKNNDLIDFMFANHDFDPSLKGNELIKIAVYRSNSYVFDKLIKDDRVDPSVGSNYCLDMCIKRKDTNMVRRLLGNRKVASSISPMQKNKLIENKLLPNYGSRKISR